MKIKKHYAWVICIAGLLMFFCSVGMVNTTLSIYMPQVRAGLQLTNTQVVMINTIRSLSTFFTMMVAVGIYRRISIRRGVALALLFMAAGLIVCALATHVIHCYVGAALMGVTYSLGANLPVTLLVNNWFKTNRATGLAICTCGSSICTMIMTPLLTALVRSFGLTSAMFIEVVFTLVCMVIIYLMIRDLPSDIGTTPYEAAEKEGAVRKKRLTETDQTTKGILAAVLIAHIFIGFSGNPFVSNLIIHYETSGYDSMLAARAVSGLGTMMLIGKFLYGIISDRFGTFLSNLICFAAWIAGAFITSMVDGVSVPLIYTSSILAGIGLPLGSVGLSLWASELTGKEHKARILQISQTCFTAGTLAGSVFPGVVADATSSYAPAFFIYGILFTVAFVVIQGAYLRRAKQ